MGTLACFAGFPLMVVGIPGPLHSGRAEQRFGMLLGEAGILPKQPVLPEVSQVARFSPISKPLPWHAPSGPSSA